MIGWWIACAEPEVPEVPVAPDEPSSPATTVPPTTPEPTTPTVEPPDPGGTATWRYSVDGVVLCDQAVDLELSPVVNRCPDCTWAWSVAATSTLNLSAVGDCGPWSTGFADEPANLWQDYEVNPRVGFAPLYVDRAGGEYPNAVLRGYDVRDDYGNDGYRNGWDVWAWEGAAGPPTLHPLVYTFDATSVDVERTTEFTGFATTTGDSVCWADVVGENHPAVAGGAVGVGELACDGSVDRWTFHAVAGDTVALSVDTADPLRAFDPWVGVALDSCWIHLSDDVFDCGVSVLPDGCPGTTFVAPYTGSYTIEVRGADGSCSGQTGAYTVSVDGTAALTLDEDDVAPELPQVKVREESSLQLVLPAP